MCRVNGCPLLWIFPCLALGAEHRQPADQAGCGLNASRLENTLTVPFTGCYVENVSSEPVVFIHTNGLKCQNAFPDGQLQPATVVRGPARRDPSRHGDVPPGSGVHTRANCSLWHLTRYPCVTVPHAAATAHAAKGTT